MPAQDQIDAEAAGWLMRRHGGLSDAQAKELQAWLQADPRHAAAWQDMQHTWDALRRMPAAQGGAMPSAARHAPPPRRTAALPPHRAGWWAPAWTWPPRPWIQALAAVCVAAWLGCAWIGWLAWRQSPVFERSFATQRGQLITVHLPDAKAGSHAPGTELSLDAATRVHARLYRDRREVHLIEGQALFSVAPDAQRPFHLRAAGLRITVVGTRFSVRHIATGSAGAPTTTIAVQEGRVRVAAIGAAESAPAAGSPGAAEARQELELVAGQRVTADAAGRLGPVTMVADHEIAPWRQGRINLDHTPLAQAIAEFERYGRTGLVVHDAAVAALPVGGSYGLTQWQRFAEALPEVLPVRLVRRADLIEVVAHRDRAGR